MVLPTFKSPDDSTDPMQKAFDQYLFDFMALNLDDIETSMSPDPYDDSLDNMIPTYHHKESDTRWYSTLTPSPHSTPTYPLVTVWDPSGGELHISFADIPGFIRTHVQYFPKGNTIDHG